MPPPDLKKPPIPYRPPLVLSIRPHVPPEPFGTPYAENSYRPMADPKRMKGFTQIQWCLEHPVLDTASPENSTERSLRLVSTIACQNGRGAQLMRCCFDDDIDDRFYVAKIYGPLYYHYAEEGFAIRHYVTWNAGHDYGCEAAAYGQIASVGRDGELTAKYYGSWTFNMPIGEGSDELRPVRMILIEWINVFTMESLIAMERLNNMPPKHRLDILAQAMEAESKLAFYGVLHRDFAPRDILLAEADSIETQMPKIYLIDFNISAVYTRTNCIEPRFETARPISPRYLFWDDYCLISSFRDWLPAPHRNRVKVFKGWLNTQWAELGEFSGPTREMKRQYNFREKVEIASPEWD